MSGTSQQRFAPGQSVGGYVLESLLGEGGFGIVFKARAADGTPVVLKIMKPHIGLNEQALARWFLEVKVLRTIRHANVVRLIASGKVGLSPYYVMEHVDGITLKEYMARCPIFGPREAAEIARQIASALAEAHERNILHRDLKPENVLVTRTGQVKLIDFGLAKELETDCPITAANAFLGTPAYMSPEQIRARRLDARSDLYSLGVLLYELLIGVNPFRRARDLRGTVTRHLTCVPRPVDTIRKGIPAPLAELVSHLLEKEPAKRPPSAFHVAAQLDRVVRCMDRVREMAAKRKEEGGEAVSEDVGRVANVA